jgi:DMSO reductase family type II enzyme chaperone
VYATLARALRPPDATVAESISDGSLASGLREALDATDVPSAALDQLAIAVEGASLAQAYLELFELGGPAGPPAVVYEGELGGGRLKVMEDVLRFYDHFGLDPAPTTEYRDRPDHVATELEFMHYLAFREAGAVGSGADPTPYRAAQRDFLAYHLCDLAGTIADRVEPRGVPFYSALTGVTKMVCSHDAQALR